MGKYADLVVLSDDIFQIDAQKIQDVAVLKTMVNGEFVFQKNNVGRKRQPPRCRFENHVRQDSKYARGGEMRNVVDRCTKFAVLCDEAF